MGLIDKHIKTIIQMSTLLNENDIFNIYQLKGALPEKICKDERGKRILQPYTQSDMFVLFGIEEGDNSKETGIITEDFGAPKGKIIVLTTLKVKVLFSGDDADFYALKFKARMWSTKVQNYLEENNITILTQNPPISFETEEIAGEFWDKRGIHFYAVLELHFEDEELEELKTLGETHFHNIEEEKK